MIVKVDFEAFGERVLRAPWMVDEMRRRAEAMKAYAESIAPFDAGDTDGDHYRDRFTADAGIMDDGHGGRAYGELRNDHPAALSIEFGTAAGVDAAGRKHGATPEHATLRKALDAR